MIRSATASPARCREVFPSAGLPPLALGLELELALVLVLEPELVLALALEPELVRADVVVMGRSSPSGNELSSPGASPAAFWGERSRRSVPARALRAAMRPLSVVSGLLLQFGAMGRFYAPLGRLRGIARGSIGAGRPPGLSEPQCGPFPGFQGFFLRFGAMGRFYAPLGRLQGVAWGSRGAAAAVRRGCRGGPGGEFRGCGAGI